MLEYILLLTTCEQGSPGICFEHGLSTANDRVRELHMARTKRSTKLDTWNARKKVPKGKTKQEPLAPGQYLGYRSPKSGAAGSWLARWRKDEQVLQVRLGTADDFHEADGEEVLTYAQAEAKAKTWFKAKAHEALREEGGEVVAKGPYTVAVALRDYFEDGKRRGVKGLTRDEQRAGAWILPDLGSLEVSSLTRARLESWLAKVAESPRRVRTKMIREEDAPAPKPRNFKVSRPSKPGPLPPAPPATEDEKRARKDSANRVLTVLKAALNHALDRCRASSGEAWQSVKPFRGVGKARVRFLSKEEQVRLVNACPMEFRSLIQGALLTGARYGELSRMRVEDFNATAGTVFIAESKSGKPRHVVLTVEGCALFTEMTAGRHAGDLVFLRGEVERRKREDLGNAWGHSDQARLMREACKAARLEQLTFHELRHSYASMLVNAGCPLAYVAAQLGHSDTRMVEKHYGHLAPSALADSIRALMPKLGLMEAPKLEPLKVAGGSR